jgi:hypothetical protein
LLERVINLPDIDAGQWKVEDDHMSETQIFNSQIKFMIEREGKYFGFGCKSFSVFTKKDGNDYEVKKTSENVNFANVTLIESEYLYVIQEAVEKRASGFYIQDLTSFIDIKDDGWVGVSLSGSFKLKYALGGHSYHLNYYKQEERIAY